MMPQVKKTFNAIPIKLSIQNGTETLDTVSFTEVEVSVGVLPSKRALRRKAEVFNEMRAERTAQITALQETRLVTEVAKCKAGKDKKFTSGRRLHKMRKGAYLMGALADVGSDSAETSVTLMNRRRRIAIPEDDQVITIRDILTAKGMKFDLAA